MLSAAATKAVALNHDGRADFISRSKRLQQIILNGTSDELNEYIEDLEDASKGGGTAEEPIDGSGTAAVD